jgi:hypothetical protein
MRRLVKTQIFNFTVMCVVVVSTAFAVITDISDSIQSVMSLVSANCALCFCASKSFLQKDRQALRFCVH